MRGTDFDRKWKICAPTDLPNNGVDHIFNLRACCTDCNSLRRKGAKELTDGLIGVFLADSSKIRDAALEVQSKVHASRETLESVLRLVGALTPDEMELLWESELNQSLVASVFESAASLGETVLVDVVPASADCYISLQATARDYRRMAAMQLDVGVSRDSVVETCVEAAQAYIQRDIEFVVPGWYLAVQNATTGSVDWRDVDFQVKLRSLSPESETWSLEFDVVVESDVEVPVVHQSQDGGDLVEGVIRIAHVSAALSINAWAGVQATTPTAQAHAEVVSGPLRVRRTAPVQQS